MPYLRKRPAYFHDGGDWHVLVDDFIYYDANIDQTIKIAAPFRWDLGSVMEFVPRIFVPHGDEMTYPSLVHDYLYRTHETTRRHADRMLRELLIEEFRRSEDIFGYCKSFAAWTAVRLGGKRHWDNRKVNV